MNINTVKPTTIAGLKRLAGHLGRANGLTRQQALDAAARQAGHGSYRLARHALGALRDPEAALSPNELGRALPPVITGGIFERRDFDKSFKAALGTSLVVSLGYDDMEGRPRVLSARMELQSSPIDLVPQFTSGESSQFFGWRHRAADRLVGMIPGPVPDEVVRRIMASPLRLIQFADVTGFRLPTWESFHKTPNGRRSHPWMRRGKQEDGSEDWEWFIRTEDGGTSAAARHALEQGIWPGMHKVAYRHLPWPLHAEANEESRIVVQVEHQHRLGEVLERLTAVEPFPLEGPAWREDESFDAIETPGERLQREEIARGNMAWHLSLGDAGTSEEGSSPPGTRPSAFFRRPRPVVRMKRGYHARLAEFVNYVEEVALHLPAAREDAIFVKAELGAWAQHELGNLWNGKVPAQPYGAIRRTGPDVHSHVRPDGRLPADLRDLALRAIDEAKGVLRMGYPPCDTVEEIVRRLERIRATLAVWEL